MNNLSFRISTGLKNIIGRDLISDKFIAVFELVKIRMMPAPIPL